MRPQSPEIRFAPRDRLLVLAPHPDDETLASGELIQIALAAGAHVRVLFVTDGANNPWPQRWIEKRLWINAAARRRWGERRRGEAAAALKVLGEGRITSRFLGFPDQGITAALMDDPALLDALIGEIAGFLPTHLVAPVLGDRHPDHGALHILGELALLRTRHDCSRLGYLVHGSGGEMETLGSDPARQQRKLAALECHASQLALSRARLQEIARRPERFAISTERGGGVPYAAEHELRIDLGAGHGSHRRHQLLVVVAARDRIWCGRARLRARGRVEMLGDSALRLRLDGAVIVIACPRDGGSIRAAWAKQHRREPRLVVFDRLGWHAFRQDAR
ncbi:MAG: PIG-L family deacetylase [Dokdonella sp.]|uniref:PIG-L deacetylase family protein n=1 Tax=Dokdonella sp. TaxID=2291710 RepID=UPI0025BB8B53|nr:PIG-L family deacetylase [Dokdonella sp.]MBZ0223328.1 PIG-L family deacetylase [Dokdonella sp.]MCC7254511.1 PIG-L family deacetylase [Dokdonella sp.]